MRVHAPRTDWRTSFMKLISALDPARKRRYRERSSAERVNSNLKDNYGGRFVRVRGADKVLAHLMFGIVALCATQLYRLLE